MAYPADLPPCFQGQGVLICSYDKVASKIGEPVWDPDVDMKSRYYWHFESPDGSGKAAIYDWHCSDTAITDVREAHTGGLTPRAAEHVKEVMGDTVPVDVLQGLPPLHGVGPWPADGEGGRA